MWQAIMSYKDPAKAVAHRAKYYKNHRDHIKRQVREYARIHREEKKAYQRIYYQEHRPNLLQRQRITSAKYWRSNREKVAIKNTKWRAANPDKVKAYTIKWRLAHKERVKETASKYNRLNRQKKKRYASGYYQMNRKAKVSYSAKYRQEHPNKVAETQRNWLKKNYQKVLAKNARRRVRKRGNQVEPYSRIDIIKRDGSRCHICKRIVAKRELTLDHLIPVSKGGPDAPWNVAVAHRSCNSQRGVGRIPAQFPLFANL